MFGPVAQLGAGAGFSGSSSAGQFHGRREPRRLQLLPKASTLPAIAWVAIGVVALLVLVKVAR